MSRNYSLKYNAKNPRSVRGAKKRGWTVVEPRKYIENVSWVGLNIWADRNCKGHFVSSFMLNNFAFENGADAMLFQLKWT